MSSSSSTAFSVPVPTITNEDRINLQRIMGDSNVTETTDEIRRLKHSTKIAEDVRRLEELKHTYSRIRKSNKAQFEQMAISKCQFIFNTYTNIFNRLMKDELDLAILSKFLTILKKIEDGDIDQHQGSYMVGSLLKELYLDSALKKEEKMKKKERKAEQRNQTSKPKTEIKNISWNQFKNTIS